MVTSVLRIKLLLLRK